MFQPTPEKNVAAQTLQAHWRGYLARKVANKLKRRFRSRLQQDDPWTSWASARTPTDSPTSECKYTFKAASSRPSIIYTTVAAIPKSSRTAAAPDMSVTATDAFYASIRERMNHYTS